MIDSTKLGTTRINARKKKNLYKQNFEKFELGMIPPEFIIINRGKGSRYQEVVDTYRGYGSFKALQLCSAINAPVNIHYYFDIPRCGTIGYEIYMKPCRNKVGYVHFIDADNYPSKWKWGGVELYEACLIEMCNNEKVPINSENWYKITVEMDAETGICCIWYAERKKDEYLGETKGQIITSGASPLKEGEKTEAFKRFNGIEFGAASLDKPDQDPTYFDDLELYQWIPLEYESHSVFR